MKRSLEGLQNYIVFGFMFHFNNNATNIYESLFISLPIVNGFWMKICKIAQYHCCEILNFRNVHLPDRLDFWSTFQLLFSFRILFNTYFEPSFGFVFQIFICFGYLEFKWFNLVLLIGLTWMQISILSFENSIEMESQCAIKINLTSWTVVQSEC